MMKLQQMTTVLILEKDNSRLRETAAQLGAALQVRILNCSNALSAIELAKRYQPEVILVSLECEQLEGMRTTDVLRAVCPAAEVVLGEDDAPALKAASGL